MANAEHKPFDEAAIRRAIASIIKAIGEDPEREGIKDTPQRVAEMYTELFQGMGKEPKEDLDVEFELGHQEMVVLKDIPFYSMSEHHLLPFYGVSLVCYILNSEGRIVGVSKLARVVETIARRPQVQERMTTEIADAIFTGLNAKAAGVVIQAEHLCMIMRGIKKPGSAVITSALRGTFRSNAAQRAEFLSLIH